MMMMCVLMCAVGGLRCQCHCLDFAKAPSKAQVFVSISFRFIFISGTSEMGRARRGAAVRPFTAVPSGLRDYLVLGYSVRQGRNFKF